MGKKFTQDFRDRIDEEEGICTLCKFILTEEDDIERHEPFGILMLFHSSCLKKYTRKVEEFVAKRNAEAQFV